MEKYENTVNETDEETLTVNRLKQQNGQRESLEEFSKKYREARKRIDEITLEIIHKYMKGDNNEKV